MNMRSPYKKENTERKKMSSQEVSITVKSGNCETGKIIFSGKDLFDKTFSNT